MGDGGYLFILALIVLLLSLITLYDQRKVVLEIWQRIVIKLVNSGQRSGQCFQ
jgi:hypothetical protein